MFFLFFSLPHKAIVFQSPPSPQCSCVCKSYFELNEVKSQKLI